MCLFHGSSLGMTLLLSFVTPAPDLSDKQQQGVLYFSTTAGTRLIYQQAEDEVTVCVTSVDRRDDAFVVSVDTLLKGMKVSSEKLSVSKQSISRLEFDREAIDPPECIVKAQSRSQHHWQVERAGNAAGFKVMHTVVGCEVVKVPAGIYKAIRIDSEYADRHTTRRSTAWYAAGVGLVKEVIRADTGEVIPSKVLKSVLLDGH
jgi:hypothetical protein